MAWGGRWVWFIGVVVAVVCFEGSDGRRFWHGRGNTVEGVEVVRDVTGMLRNVEYRAELLKPVLVWVDLEAEGAAVEDCASDGRSMKISGSSLSRRDFRRGDVLVFYRTDYEGKLGCSPPAGLSEGEAEDPQVFVKIRRSRLRNNMFQLTTEVISGSRVIPDVYFTVGPPYPPGGTPPIVRREKGVALDKRSERITRTFTLKPLDGVDVFLTLGADATLGEFDFFRDGASIGVKFEVGAELSADLGFTLNTVSEKFVEYNRTLVQFPIPSLATPQFTIGLWFFTATFGAGFDAELNLVADLTFKIRTLIQYGATFTFKYEIICRAGAALPVDINVIEEPDIRFGDGNGIFELEEDLDGFVGAKLTGFLGVRPALETEISFFGTFDADIGVEFGGQLGLEFREPPFEPKEEAGLVEFGDCDSCHYIEGNLQLVGKTLSFQSELLNYELVLLNKLFDIQIGTACWWTTLCEGDCAGTCKLSNVCTAEGGTVTFDDGCDQGSQLCCEDSTTEGCIMPGGVNGICLPESTCNRAGQYGVNGFCQDGSDVCCVNVGDSIVLTCSLDDGRRGRCITSSSCAAIGGKQSVFGECSGSRTGSACCVDTLPECTVPDGRQGTCENSRNCEDQGKLSVPDICTGLSTVGCCVDPNVDPPETDCVVGDGREGVCISTADCAALEKESVSGFCSGSGDIRCCVEPNRPVLCTTDDGRRGTCAPTRQCATFGNESVPNICTGSADIQCCVEPNDESDSCTVVADGRTGTCVSTAECTGQGFESVPNLCPGPADIQCCVEPNPPETCMSDGREGECVSTGECAGQGFESVPNLCPGAADIQCCVDPNGPVSCSVPDGRDGTCIPLADCAEQGLESVPLFCPGATIIQCCVDPLDLEPCVADGRLGTCQTTASCSEQGGSSIPGFCPFGADIQCCVDLATPTQGPECTTSDDRMGNCEDDEACSDPAFESVPGNNCGTGKGCCVPRLCFFSDSVASRGTCISTESCTARGGTSYPRICPDGSSIADVTCCRTTPGVGQICGVPYSGTLERIGVCGLVSRCELDERTESVPGYCTGASDIQCCVNKVAGCVTSELAEGTCLPPSDCDDLGFVTDSVNNYLPCASSAITECCINPSPPPLCEFEDYGANEPNTCTSQLSCQRIGGTVSVGSLCDLNQVCCTPPSCPTACVPQADCFGPVTEANCPGSLVCCSLAAT